MLEIHLIGNVGQDAKILEVNAAKFISFSVGTSEKWKNAAGEKQEKTTWVSCILDAKSPLLEYLKKGTKVYIQGDLSVKSYKDNNGNQQAAVNCRVRRTELLSAKKDDSDGATTQATPEPNSAAPEDDLPF